MLALQRFGLYFTSSSLDAIALRALLGTQDMGLCIALLCKGYILADLKQSGHTNRVTFRFLRQDGLHKAVQAYWNGQLQVDAKTYWSEAKTVKTRLYNLRQPCG